MSTVDGRGVHQHLFQARFPGEISQKKGEFVKRSNLGVKDISSQHQQGFHKNVIHPHVLVNVCLGTAVSKVLFVRN